MLVVAELSIYHSRPVAPTRRVALGTLDLPVEPAPGFGGVLLAGVVAHFASRLDADCRPDLESLMRQVERGARVAQPKLRHRLQRDNIGLSESRHCLLAEGERLSFSFGDGVAEPCVLGAIYAVQAMSPEVRTIVMAGLRTGLGWRSAVGSRFIGKVIGRANTAEWSAASVGNPQAWARRQLGLIDVEDVARDDVQRRFRTLLRTVHPDNGGDTALAAQRIADLSEARRILLG